MRGTYEAFILVEIKDGTQYVCALNREQRRAKGRDDTLSDKQGPEEIREFREFRESQVIWN